MNKGRKKEKKKKKNHIKKKKKKKKKKKGQNGKVNACAPVSCLRQEPPAAARDLAGLSKGRPLEPLVCSNWAYKVAPGDSRSRPTRLAWSATCVSTRVLVYAHNYRTSPHPSLGIPGTLASCWGRRESHSGYMLLSVLVLYHCAECGVEFLRIGILRNLT
jgi:hypothetical protein